MESSPLIQQNTPDAFYEPKIVQLYLYLFNVLVNEPREDAVPSEGYWRELFLLHPDKKRLSQILEPLTAEDVLLMQASLPLQSQTRAFFQRAIAEVGSGVSPRNENALENLTAFLYAILGKRYTNPSADIIEVLAGLDSIDKTVSDLVSSLEAIIRQSSRPSLREKGIETALVLVAGAYQTTLVSYFIHRDLFPALMKTGSSQSKYVIAPITRRPSVEEQDRDFEALVLVGLLANYEKFESQNPYQTRLDDFVNEEVMHRLAWNMGLACRSIRDAYAAVQDDAPEGWTLNSTLAFVGLRALSPEPKTRKAPLTEDEIKDRLTDLPSISATICLPIYSFVQANKLFASALAMIPADPKSHESPVSSFLSSTSYIAHHAHRSTRAMSYTILNLLTLRILVEDPITLKRLTSSDADSKYTIRLARQRSPFLPQITTPRIPITAILDISIDTISHNLRRRLDVPLYSLTLAILHTTTTHLATTKTRLSHHWTHIWAALLTLLRFTVTYATDLVNLRGFIDSVATPLTTLLAHCLSQGDAFLPDPQSYDDLFYKLVEAGETIAKFRDIYCSPTPSQPTSSSAGKGAHSTAAEIQLSRSSTALLSISRHYQPLLATRKHQSPAAVVKVIKDGYETLNLEDMAGGVEEFGGLGKYREGEWKGEIKRILRVVVEDARGMGMR